MRYEFVRFIIVGVVNTVISYALYLILLAFFNYIFAYSISYCMGILISYFLNAKFVFNKHLSFAGFLKFPIVYLIQYTLGVFVLWLLVENFSVYPEIAMVVTIIVSIPITFLASRFLLKN